MFRGTIAGLLMLLSPFVWSPPAAADDIRAEALVKLVEEVEIPAREAGPLTALDLQEGQLIRSGQVIGQVDDTEVKLTMQQLTAELELADQRAQSDVQVRLARRAHRHAVAEFERVDQIRQTAPRVVSEAELEKYRWEMDKAELEIERLIEERRQMELTRAAKAVEYAAAEHAVQRRRLISPLDGVVVQVYRHRGEWVQIGERIARVLRIDRVRAEAFVPLQADLMQLEGAPAVLEIASPGRAPAQFAGKVVFVNPEIDPVNNQVRVWVELENADRRLHPGHRGRLTIQPASSGVKAGTSQSISGRQPR